ncbi:RloB family protein [Actinomadura bangladeshensis]|uniref:RloB domain-containing protein n=1 Tax=Actinomadura bangladeshensis TaxID=453573 RepID=A0A4R4NDE7_9ACTN|nr:RloB family protein [Actinomadura bangladeshensis]TDC05450.1 RloB domain-containing protein [Actinomadura bangladeshensis]
MAHRRSKALQRKQGKLAERKRFLIYCEGEVTERLYLGAWKRQLRIPGVKFGSTFGEPLGLVRAAIDHQSRAPHSADDQYMAYDHVWCVVDVEAPNPHPGLERALVLASRNGVKVALTNPCFELWLMLHLVDHRGYLTTDQACRWLEKYGDCDYSQDAKVFDTEKVLRGYEDARSNALRLTKGSSEADVIRGQNPSSSAWEFVDKLRRQVE